MKTLLATTAVLLSLAAPAFADEDKPDYLNNKETYACDNEQLTEQLKGLYSDSNDVIRVIYVKGAKEVSRTADGLRCKITLVASRGTVSGLVTFKYEDGHALFGFEPGKSR